LKGKNNFEEVGVHGRIILKYLTQIGREDVDGKGYSGGRSVDSLKFGEL
jgi:hypothetical protein